MAKRRERKITMKNGVPKQAKGKDKSRSHICVTAFHKPFSALMLNS